MKIGIITMYYKSYNYGGILQAYALARFLVGQGISCEQICYDLFSGYSYGRRFKNFLRQAISTAFHLKKSLQIHKRKVIVKKSSLALVPHSKKVYLASNIGKCVKNYDIFVTGSDQVWHGEWPAYFLSFVHNNKRKVAYAASTGKTVLSMDDVEKIRKYAEDFAAISVREADTAEFLQRFIPGKRIEHTLDPTLLLTRAEWENVSSRRKITERYIFCYFLGPDIRMRQMSVNYAKRHNLIIVTIPYMQQRFEKNDVGFGDKQLFDATPQDFLSYIQYADVVFTDSFHACVFSHIFQRQYIAFGRPEEKEMNNRLCTLTKMVHTEHRFIFNDMNYNMEYIENIEKINYSVQSLELEKMKEKSKKFLVNNLKGTVDCSVHLYK